MAYEWTMHIDAPPEKVFDVLSDVANHGSWANPRAELKVALSCRPFSTSGNRLTA